jgi:hypothetical protein
MSNQLSGDDKVAMALMEVRDPTTVVLEAELMASSPDRVHAWLEERGRKVTRSFLGEDQRSIEQALLGREDPLIDLGLAQYAIFPKTIAALFSRQGPAQKALRLAVLSNEPTGRGYHWGVPHALYSRAKDEAAKFLATLDAEEIWALFRNSEIDDSFLLDFLEMKETWQVLDEARRLLAIRSLGSNPRMNTRYSGPMDGYAEYSHNRVFDAAWNLAVSVPTTMMWAGFLGGLYSRTNPKSFAIKNPFEVAARWTPDPSDEKTLQSEQKGVERGYLGVYARVRQALAGLAVRSAYSDKDRESLLTHSDPAVRAAAYRDAELTLEQMKAADARDPMLAFNTMLDNKGLWRRSEYRKLLHDMAWAPARDPNSPMDAPNAYNWHLEDRRKEFPEWFKDEDDTEKPDRSTLRQDMIEYLQTLRDHAANARRRLPELFKGDTNIGELAKQAEKIAAKGEVLTADQMKTFAHALRRAADAYAYCFDMAYGFEIWTKNEIERLAR